MKHLNALLLAVVMCILIPCSVAWAAEPQLPSEIGPGQKMPIDCCGGCQQGLVCDKKDCKCKVDVPNLDLGYEAGAKPLEPIDIGKIPSLLCGNGKWDIGEQCDLSCNASNDPKCDMCKAIGRTCDADCQCACPVGGPAFTACPPAVICGDGKLEGSEGCEVGQECKSTSNLLLECKLDKCECEEITCGNNKWDFDKGEECDPTADLGAKDANDKKQCEKSGGLTQTHPCMNDCKCPPPCSAKTCAQLAVFCGEAMDDCLNKLDCGLCPPGKVCKNNQCIPGCGDGTWDHNNEMCDKTATPTGCPDGAICNDQCQCGFLCNMTAPPKLVSLLECDTKAQPPILCMGQYIYCEDCKCKAPTCGDGIVNGQDECEPGNIANCPAAQPGQMLSGCTGQCKCEYIPLPQCDMDAANVPWGFECTNIVVCQQPGYTCKNCLCFPPCMEEANIIPPNECSNLVNNCIALNKICDNCKCACANDAVKKTCKDAQFCVAQGLGTSCDLNSCTCQPPPPPFCVLMPNQECTADADCVQKNLGTKCDLANPDPKKQCKCISICDINGAPMPPNEIECSANKKCPNPYQPCDGDCKCKPICGDGVKQPNSTEECDMAHVLQGPGYLLKLYAECGYDPDPNKPKPKGILKDCTAKCQCDYVQPQCMDLQNIVYPNCSSTILCPPGEQCDSGCRCYKEVNLCAGKECTSSADCDADEICDIAKCECVDKPKIEEKVPGVETHVTEIVGIPQDDCEVYALTFSSEAVATDYKDSNDKARGKTGRKDDAFVEPTQWGVAICRVGGATIPELNNPADKAQLAKLNGNPLPDAADNLLPYMLIQGTGPKLQKLEDLKYMTYEQIPTPLQLLPVAGTADAQVAKAMMAQLSASIPAGVVPMSDAQVSYEAGNVVINNSLEHKVFSVTPGQTYTLSSIAGAPAAQIVAKAEELPAGTAVAVHIFKIRLQYTGTPYTAVEGFEKTKLIEERMLSLDKLFEEISARKTEGQVPDSSIYAGTSWDPSLNYNFTLLQQVYTTAETKAAAQTVKGGVAKVQMADTGQLVSKQMFAMLGKMPSELGYGGGGCKCNMAGADPSAGQAILLIIAFAAPAAGYTMWRIRRKR